MSNRATLLSGAAATGADEVLLLDEGIGVGVQAIASDDWSGTVQWEATMDGENWVAVPLKNLATLVAATTATAAGAFANYLPGMLAFRANVTAYTAGTLTVRANLLYPGDTLPTDVSEGSDGSGVDVYFYGDTEGRYAHWDMSADTLGLMDNTKLGFGNTAAAPDVYLLWDANSLNLVATGAAEALEIGAASHLINTTLTGTLTVGVNDTGHDVKLFGATAGAYLLWDESADALVLAGNARLDLSACTLLATNTDGGVIKAGTSAAPVTEDTAGMKFISLYFDDGATSGDARGIYNRLSITGAGGGGESLRSYTDVVNVAGATAHGAHISLGLGASGSLTGQGIGVRATLHLPTTALPASNVTYAPLQAEVYSDGNDSDPSGNLLSLIRLVNDGGNGKADVDDDAALMELIGFTADTGNMVSANTAAKTTLDFENWVALRIRIGSTVYYIPAAQAITATGA